MALFFKQLNNWKIRKIAVLFFGLLISIMITNFVIVYTLGIDTEDLVQKDKISLLKIELLKLAPDLIEEYSEESLKEKAFRIDIENLLLSQGGEENRGNKKITIKPAKGEIRNKLQNYIKGWEEYKTSIFNDALENNRQRLFTTLQLQLNDLESGAIQYLESKREDLFVAIFVTVGLNFLAFSFIYLIMRFLIMGPIYKISLTSRKLAKGNLSEQIDLQQNNEIGYIAQNINSLVDILKSATSFSQEIGKGHLDARYKALEGENLEENNLATALINMRDQMAESNLAEKERSWVTQGLAQFADTLRSNNDNLQLLCTEVVTNLVKYLDANQGAIFVISEDQKDQLDLISAYAYERKKRINKSVLVGEGLVGQSFRERDTLYITEIPEDYIQIRSGLGMANPKFLLLVPLKNNEDIQGVIEIASFNDIKPYQISFVEKLGETIAATISTTRINEKTKKLLEESRQMTEELRAQEEEMRQNMEEMQATQEEMRRTQQELGNKEANLNALINNTEDSIITMSKDYKVMIVNDVQKRRYKGTQYEGIGEGANALEMLGSVRDEWKGYYDRALSGERLDFVIKSSVRGEDSYRQYFINPIRDHYNEVVGLSVFSRDVTKQKIAEIQNKNLVQDLSQKTKLFDSISYFIELNADKKIAKINELGLHALGYKESDLIGQHVNKILKNDEALNDGHATIAQGEVWKENTELKTKSGSLMAVQSLSTAILSENGEVIKYVMLFTKI